MTGERIHARKRRTSTCMYTSIHVLGLGLEHPYTCCSKSGADAGSHGRPCTDHLLLTGRAPAVRWTCGGRSRRAGARQARHASPCRAPPAVAGYRLQAGRHVGMRLQVVAASRTPRVVAGWEDACGNAVACGTGVGGCMRRQGLHGCRVAGPSATGSKTLEVTMVPTPRLAEVRGSA